MFKDSKDNKNLDVEQASIDTASDVAPDEDQRLRIQGEQNPYYVHELRWTEAEEKEIVRIFDFKILSWIGLMCKDHNKKGPRRLFVYARLRIFANGTHSSDLL